MNLTSTTHTEQQTYTYKLSPKRWLIMAIFSALFLSNALLWMGYAPVPEATAEFYNVSIKMVNFLGMIFQIIGAIGLLPSALLVQRLGLRKMVVAAATFNITGAWIRVLGGSLRSYAVCLIGQSFAAMVPTIMLVIPPYLASAWLGENERAIGLALGSFSNIFGISIAYLLAPLWPIPTVQLIFACLVSIPYPFVLFMFSEGPETHPSKSAGSTIESMRTFSFGQSLKAVLTNLAFHQLNIAYGFGFGIFVCVLTLLPQILALCGFSVHTSGFLGAAFIMCGAVGSGIAGRYMDKTRNYRVAIITGYFGAFAALLLMAISVFNGPQLSGLCIASLLFGGLFSLSILPITLELGVEYTYGTPPVVNTSILFLTGSAFGVIELLIVSQFSAWVIPWILAGIALAGLGLVATLKSKYKRLEYERI